MTYPGESLEYYDAADGSDLTLYGDVYYRTDVGRTIASGDVWRFWYRADWQVANRYLTDAGADVEVSWVVEVASGTGTLVAAETVGLDPPDTSASAGTALGTYPVTGAGTIVIPSVLMGAAEIVDGPEDGRNMLRLECTSGSIHVQQVKIRVTPPGGFVGGWSDPLPGFTTTHVLPSMSGAFVARSTEYGDTADFETAWDTAMAAVAGSTGGDGPHPLTSAGFTTPSEGGTSWRAATPEVSPFIDMTATLSGTVAQVSGTPHGAIVVLGGPNPATTNPIAPELVDGVDYHRPPTEIAGDLTYLVQQVGSAGWDWENATATVTTDGQPTPVPAIGVSVATESTPTNPVVAGEIDRDMDDAGAVAYIDSTDATTALPLTPTSRYLVVYISASFAASPPPYPGIAPFTGGRSWQVQGIVHFGSGTPGALFNPMRVALQMPSYRVWLAGGGVVPPMRLMQRGDGLGMGSGSLLGVSTRQGSSRLLGSY